MNEQATTAHGVLPISCPVRVEGIDLQDPQTRERIRQVVQDGLTYALQSADLLPRTMQMAGVKITSTVTVGQMVIHRPATLLERTLAKQSIWEGSEGDRAGIITYPMTLMTEQDFRNTMLLDPVVGGVPDCLDITAWPGFVYDMSQIDTEEGVDFNWPEEAFSEQFREFLCRVVALHPGMQWLRLIRSDSQFDGDRTVASQYRVNIQQVHVPSKPPTP